MLEPDRTFARRDTALFVLCVALSVGALFAPEPWQFAMASTARNTALAPLICAAAARRGFPHQPRPVRAAHRPARLGRHRGAVAPVHPQRKPPSFGNCSALARRLTDAERRPPRSCTSRCRPTAARCSSSAGRNAGVAPFQAVVSSEGLIGVVRSGGPEHVRRDDLGAPGFPRQRRHDRRLGGGDRLA